MTYKSTWFLVHRIREAMRDREATILSGNVGVVQVDEAFIGKKKGAVERRVYYHKMNVFALAERNSGKARTRVITDLKAETGMPLVNV